MISSISEFELRYGLEQASKFKSRSKSMVETMLSEMSIFNLGSAEAAKATEVRNSLRIQGKPIGPYDVLIAATALVFGLILVRQLSELKNYLDTARTDSPLWPMPGHGWFQTVPWEPVD